MKKEGRVVSGSCHSKLTVTATVAECDIVPLLPVTVIVYVPGVVRSDADTVMVEVPVPFAVRTTLAGLKDAVGLERESDAVVSAGATVAERFTVPKKL